MKYVAEESKTTKGEWRVECVHESDEGAVTVVIFSGYMAEKCAKDYAAEHNRSEWGLHQTSR